MQSDPDGFSQVVLEQISRPEERRCPIARASNEIVELLSEHWAIFAPGCKPHSCSSVGFDLTSSFRLNVDDLPTILPELLQGPYLGPQLFFTNVE